MARRLYLAGGFVSLGLGAIGAFLPLLPTVPFVILAAWCFARSSPALERRLLEDPRFGAHIRRWRAHGAISRRGKLAASVAFAMSVIAALAFAAFPWSLVTVAAAAIGGTWIWTRPED
ncbi:YbaN family protein [Sphingomonas canadensis]|uniref:YbaN family protein n=1 Tax=Sphingomonas canadensis TaxID=1219257 RepID=A0ABW3H1G2_9SPHN|nr:YbaN family protein [Sphingomonas canadensis]MCW3834831.1 YbaN family protein [Sphingomonas canadensis]